jgi:hypothetical protein
MVTMSQKSSVLQPAKSVSQALTPDTHHEGRAKKRCKQIRNWDSKKRCHEEPGAKQTHFVYFSQSPHLAKWRCRAAASSKYPRPDK